jgi:hypothetical protein
MRQSERLGELGTALAKAQAAIQPAAKHAENPHLKSKYADLTAVWDACRTHLTCNGIAVVQSPAAEDAQVTVTTRLIHTSGEWIEGALTMRAKDASPQSIGSTITYGRRYGLASMVGVAPEDDDAEAAAPARQPRRETRQIQTTPTAFPVAVINDAQRKRLWTIAKANNWTEDDLKALLRGHGFESSKDITTQKYDAIVSGLETGVMNEEVVTK